MSGPVSVIAGELQPGQVIRRYIVVNKIGQGGMGVVYAAQDPALKRSVALKLLRGDGSGATALLDEAQNMARLTHPNVVAVHDVALQGQEIFIAMELMRMDLRGWLHEKARTPREIIRMFLQAGQGLLAAHDAGLVHRDFKPENVLIGEDGRPRVSDFGLATGTNEAKGRAGTPDYMAPEQAQGGTVDARADQFSFCVSLYEALYGRKPFPSPRDLQRPLPLLDLERGGRDVPPTVRRVLFKGLAENPAARFASMRELLSALEDDPERTRRDRQLAAAATGALVLIGAISAWLLTRESPEQRAARECSERVEQQLRSAWGPDRRSQIARAFAGSSTWPEVERRLDSEAVQWRASSLSACLQPVGAERRRFTDCLAERRKALQSMSDVFAAADGRVIENALNAVLLEVHPVAGCFSRDTARKTTALGSDADEQVRTALSRARVLMTSGKYEEALDEASKVAVEAGAVSALQVRAEAMLLVGELHTRLRRLDADEKLREAIAAADAIGNDELRLRAWIAMVAWCADHRRSHVDGRFAATYAESILVRLGRPAPLEAALLSAVGVLDAKAGLLQEAERKQRRALELRLANLPNPEEHPLVAQARTRLGLALPAAKGLPVIQSVVETSQRLFGPNHPETALALHNLGVVRLKLREYAAALDLFQQALAIREANRTANPQADPARFGREHTYIARALSALGQKREALTHAQQGFKLLQDAGADPEELYEELDLLIELNEKLGEPTDELVKERDALQVD